MKFGGEKVNVLVSRGEYRNVDFPFESITINTAFDSMANAFTINSPISILPYTFVYAQILINNSHFISGFLLSVKINGNGIYRYSFKTRAFLLERSLISEKGVTWEYSKRSLLDIANDLGRKFGIVFEPADYSAISVLNKSVDKYETKSSETAFGVISAIAKELNVMARSEVWRYNDANNELIKFFLVSNDSIQNLFDLDAEIKTLPFEFDNASITYDNNALFAKYHGLYSGNEKAFKGMDFEDYITDFAFGGKRSDETGFPYPSGKIVESKNLGTLQTEVKKEIIRDCIRACKLNLKFPFIFFRNNSNNSDGMTPITCGETFTLTSQLFGLVKRKFIVTDCNYSLTPDEISTSITACFWSAMSGTLDEE